MNGDCECVCACVKASSETDADKETKRIMLNILPVNNGSFVFALYLLLRLFYFKLRQSLVKIVIFFIQLFDANGATVTFVCDVTVFCNNDRRKRLLP